MKKLRNIIQYDARKALQEHQYAAGWANTIIHHDLQVVARGSQQKVCHFLRSKFPIFIQIMFDNNIMCFLLPVMNF